MTRHTRTQKLLGLHNYHSVVRRTFLFGLFVLPAFAANFLVHYFGTNLLSADQFGIFYVANTIGNVAYSGSVILNMFFTRYISSLVLQGDVAAGLSGFRSLQRLVIFVGGTISIAAFAILFAFSEKIGIQSLAVALMIILDAFTSYVADLGRMFLQSLRKTIPLGLYTLGWMTLRLLLFVLGVVAFHTVWGGLLGICASAVIITIVFQLLVRRVETPTSAVFHAPTVSVLFPFVMGYGLLIGISNLDILIGYFLLQPSDLSAYSASSIFPKTILVLISPLLQMLFPMMIEEHTSKRLRSIITYKILGVILTIAVSACAFVWLASDTLCGGRVGLKFCDGSTMQLMLLSIVPLTLLRLIVQLEYAHGKDWRPLLLAIPTALYIYFMLNAERSIENIALNFAVFSFAAFLFYSLVLLLLTRFRRESSAISQ